MQLNDHLGSNFHILQRQSTLIPLTLLRVKSTEEDEEDEAWGMEKEFISRAIVIDDKQTCDASMGGRE